METPSTPEPIRPLTQPAGRRRNHQQRKTPKPAGFHAPHDFLRQNFLPVSHFENFQHNRCERMERAFFQSLSYLSRHYQLSKTRHRNEPFPQNLFSAFAGTKDKLEKINPELSLILSEHEGSTCLATIEEIGISHTLYFVPLNALDWIHQQKNSQCFWLMASLFGYLHQSAAMPLLSGNDYLKNCYETISDWLQNGEDEYEEEEWKEKMCTLTDMRRKKNILEQIVQDPAQMSCFASRVSSFKPYAERESKLLTLASDLLELHHQFPGKRFWDHILMEQQDDSEEDPAYPEQYFSFFWDDNDWLCESVMEHLNCDLQERSRFIQPTIINYFTSQQPVTTSDLSFERSLLQLVAELSSVTYLFTR